MNQDKKGLSIRSKIIITILIATFAIIILTYFISSAVILKSYKTFEDNVVNINIKRVNFAIENLKNNQGTKLKDWAVWDGTYNFIKNRNQDYIDENLQTVGIVNMDVNLIAFADLDGKIILSKTINKGEELKGNGIESSLLKQNKLLKHSNPDDLVSGIITTPYGLAVVSSSPVLRSDGTGPMVGSLIMGNFLNENITKKIGDSILYPVEIFDYDNTKLIDDIAIAKNNLSNSSKRFIQVLPNDKVAGYSLIYGVDNEPIAISKVTLPRDFYNQGQKTFNIFTSILGIILLIFGLEIIFLLEKLIVHRFTKLSEQVRYITKVKDLTKKIDINSNDEIGILSNDINTMLSDLYISQKNERESVNQEKIATENLKKHLEEIEQLNKLMINRELKMIDMKKEIEENKKI